MSVDKLYWMLQEADHRDITDAENESHRLCMAAWAMSEALDLANERIRVIEEREKG